ncbi:MAG TPA: PqqD family peptide modification chaperone [Gammaproteobacteria bacterium]|nr:PqqD family peptide modification chaperone [Gammaproteobacteria bacterium]
MSKIILVIPVGRDFRLLPRCLEHYHLQGVEQIFLNVHARMEWGSDLVDRIQEIGRQYNARIGHVHHRVYTESCHTTRIILDHYAKQDDWVIYSDVDEFQEYPDSLHNIIEYCERNQYDYVRGLLLDRVAIDGSLPMLNDRSLPAQFPVAAQITGVIRHGDTNKIVLSRAGIPMGSGQHFTAAGKGAPVQTLRVTVHHFRWDSEAPANLSYMKQMLDSIDVVWAGEYQRILDHLGRNNGRFDLSDPALMVHYPPVSRQKNSPPSTLSAEYMGKITSDSILSRNKDDVLNQDEQSKYSIRRYGKKVSSLNISAAMIWTLCDGERTVDELVSDLAFEYDQKVDEVHEDVFTAIKKLVGDNLLHLLPSGNKPKNLHWNTCQQTQFLHSLDYQTHPELYRDVGLCHGLLAQVRGRKYQQQTNFHFYWRQLDVPFGDKQIATLTACLATQNLDLSNVLLWYSGATAPEHPELDKLIDDGYVQVKKYDPCTLAEGTPLEGNHGRLLLQDGKCYLDGDLFRLLVLFRFGGVYVDMDVLLLRDFSPLLTFEFMYSWGSDQPALINGAVMRFFPGSVALDRMLAEIMDSEPIPESTCWGATIYGRVRNRYHFTVLPYGFFNPEWACFEGKNQGYAESPETFMTANTASQNIYRCAYAWHWHNKWAQKVEANSKFDLLRNMLTRSWQDKKRFLGYCRTR